MTTVDDFAQGMLREYRAFAGQCAAIAAAPGAEETAAELYSMEDLPMIAARLGAFRTRAEAAEQRAEAALAQARADRTLLIGLWLATVPPDVLPTLLPADPGDRDRLASALDAVDLQVSAGSHTAAAREVIGRIVRAVAEMAGGAR
jgi:hypothetical protein